jgi:nicotinamidase/pyrazinamidase
LAALILVDLQNDFLPGGALAVPHGDEVIPVANAVQEKFPLVVATQDWHPPDHLSFAPQHPGHEIGEVIEVDGLEQILWPVHCVQGTPGAEFPAELDASRLDRVFHKGTDRRIDSYSGFFDNGHRQATGLGDYLKERGVWDVYVLGLATDYCAKFTALDAAQLGFRTHLIEDGCRGVNLQQGDVSRALEEMRAAEIEIVQSSELDPTDLREYGHPW